MLHKARKKEKKEKGSNHGEDFRSAAQDPQSLPLGHTRKLYPEYENQDPGCFIFSLELKVDGPDVSGQGVWTLKIKRMR